MPTDGKKIRVHDESVNTYGFRVKTDGWMNRQQFEANPIMLYNHSQPWRGDKSEMLPIGFWKNLEVLGEEIHGVPVFDVEDEDFAKTIAGKYERNVLRAASIGLRIVATSDDPKDMVAGQTRPTVTKWELREISIVDIPANKNAVILYDADNNLVNLSDDGGVLPIITQKQQPKSRIMEDQNLQFVAGFLGLQSGATMAQVQDGIMNLRQSNANLTAENVNLKKENNRYKEAENALKADQSKDLLDAAVKEKRITNEQRPHLQKTFEADFETGKALLASFAGKVAKLADVPDTGNGVVAPTALTYQGKTYKELDKDSPAVLASLKESNLDLFSQLFKASYGVDWQEPN